jgi:hypothetical protein
MPGSNIGPISAAGIVGGIINGTKGPEIPQSSGYNFLEPMLASGSLSAKAEPMDLAEKINGTEAGATIIVQNNESGNIKAQTNKFFLSGFSVASQERAQILETFGVSALSFFGEKAKIYNLQGTAVDYAGQSNPSQYYHQSSIIKMYDEMMRGTKLVENDNIAVLSVHNHTIYGYPLNLSVSYNASFQKTATFAMSWFVTKHLLTLPGVVNDTELRTLYSAIDMSRLDSQTAEYIANIDFAIEAINGFLNFKNYEGDLFSGVSTTNWLATTQGVINAYFADFQSDFCTAVQDKVAVVHVDLGNFSEIVSSEIGDAQAFFEALAIRFTKDTFWTDNRVDNTVYEEVQVAAQKLNKIKDNLLIQKRIHLTKIK